KKRIEEFGLHDVLESSNVVITEPIGYIDFIHLVKYATAVITDSGGVQEESTYLGVPCLTVRPSTERPVTITEGTNTLVELNSESIKSILHQIEDGRYKKGKIPSLWDGRASERNVNAVAEFLSET